MQAVFAAGLPVRAMLMTEAQRRILSFIADEDAALAGVKVWVAPTRVGMVVDNRFRYRASQWASPKMRLLTAKGLLERRDPGHYCITPAGREALKDG